ncbi:hypothetical protein IAG44_30725 [Streptomyces roseirectus]|uniref:Uncharacterized protein n=1 Tax=Streptomyces roseirectus TaxID=2768066 RepID=A0A7H0IKS5_9ACTN|nr:hypothetical protein [Streptomyces roseirectus]QNP73391.1 hypothetical protein IAG44_30725 [Streptomyces roseirectus]
MRLGRAVATGFAEERPEAAEELTVEGGLELPENTEEPAVEEVPVAR